MNTPQQRLEPSQREVAQWAVLAVGILLAVVVGWWIGSEEVVLLLLLGVLGVVVAVVAGLRERSWWLILLGWPLAGYTSVLPVPLSGRDLTVFLAAASWLGYWIITRERRRASWRVLDTLVCLNIGWLAVTFLRHPVGVSAVSSTMIGGKNYFNVVVAVLAYWVILLSPASVKTVSRIPLVILAGTTMLTLLYVVAYFLPGLREHLTFLYAAVDVNAFFAAKEVDLVAVPRYGGLAMFGMLLMVVICSYYQPQTLFNPLRPRSYLFVLAWVCTLLSGFRSFLLWNIVTVPLSTWLRRGWRSVALPVVMGGLLVLVVVLGQGRLYQLPLAAQRALSFLPGQWSSIAVDAGQVSSQERFEWWQQIIAEGGIHDWLWGRGFGFEGRELQGAVPLNFYQGQTLAGGFHSGPLSTVNYVGIAGLVLFYALMIRAAWESVNCVRRCVGTRLLPAAIFVAIQLVWWPVHYTFVFGGYDSQVPNEIFLVALLRVLIETQAEAGRLPVAAPVPARLVAATGGRNG